MTPLLAAMTFASRDIVAKLLDAGAPIDDCGKEFEECDGVVLLGSRPCTLRGAVVAGKHENVQEFLGRHPKYATAILPSSNACPLHLAAMSSRSMAAATKSSSSTAT